MADLSTRDLLLHTLSSHVGRYLNPLSLRSSNLNLYRLPKSELLDQKCLQIINSPSDPELVSLSYRYLYLQASSNIRDLVSQHQRYIVQLSSSKKHTLVLQELWTVALVLQGSRKLGQFSLSSWMCLVDGLSPQNVEPSLASFVVSHHFLVLQSILQYLSASLQSVVKGSSAITLSVFEKVAQSFLSDSNHQMCISKFAPNATAVQKYERNNAKVAAGFLKVAKFLRSKLNANETLTMGITLLELKTCELNMRIGQFDDASLPDLTNSSNIAPFIDDLKSAISLHPFPVPKLESSINSYLVSRPRSSSLNSIHGILSQLHFVEDNDLLSKLQKLLSITSPTEACEALNVSLSSLVSENPNRTLAFRSLGVVLRFLLSKFDKIEKCQSFINISDTIISKTRTQSAETSFNVYVTEVLSPLSTILFQMEQTKRVKQIAKLCFEASHSPEALKLSAQLDLSTTDKDKSDPSKLQNRIRQIIPQLCSFDDLEGALDVLDKYTEYCSGHDIVPLVIIPIVDNLFQTTKSVPAVLNPVLKLNPGLQTQLISLIIQDLDRRGSEKALRIKSFVQQFLDENTPNFLHLYKAASLADTLSIPNLSPSTPFEALCTAGIYIFCLSRGAGSYKEMLKLAKNYLECWLNLEENTQQSSEIEVFNEIMFELFHLSHFQLVQLLTDNFLLVTKATTYAVLQLELLLCRSMLETTNISEVPSVLKRAGSLMKGLNTSDRGISYSQVAEWKLLQFDYFISMKDIGKSSEKYQEILQFLDTKPGFNLTESSHKLSFNQKLGNFLIVARFLILTSKMNSLNGDFVTSLRNAKLAIKILNSILRKINMLAELKEIREDTNFFISQAYFLAFEASRHLGLLKDAMYYTNELRDFNSCCKYPIFKAFYHFALAVFYSFAGRAEPSGEEFMLGQSIATQIASSVTDTCMALSSKLITLFSGDGTFGDDNLLSDALERFEKSSNLLIGLSSKYITKAALGLDYIVFFNFSKHPSISIDNDRRKMLLKTTLEVKEKLQTLEKALFADCGTNVRWRPKILPSTTYSTCDFKDISKNLSFCKEILLRIAQEDDQLMYLNVSLTRYVSSLLSCCVFMLSFVATMKEEFAFDLLNTVTSLLDFAKALPSANQKLLISKDNTKKNNDLMPSKGEANELLILNDKTINMKLQKCLPDSCVVVSLDICELSGNLIITKFESGQTLPFVFKLPFRKNNGSFKSFADISACLQRIIEDSNGSTKKSVTTSVKTKEDRRNWWKMRFELDQRLKNLLDDVEDELLKGFKGVFFFTDRQSQEYNAFRTRLNNFWSSFLQSIGNEQHASLQLSQGLVDLYYNLQFLRHEKHYADIRDLVTYTFTELTGSNDFARVSSTMTTTLLSSIQGLYSFAATSKNEHIFLIPSNACASFPWESMECLRGRSVSRMPSVSQLIDLLSLHPGFSFPDTKPENIFYLVNPGKDLPKTEAEFGPLLQSMPNASGLCGEKPEEEHMLEQLYSSKLFLYFGHGGGEQYVRASKMIKRKTENNTNMLPPALLMGCSSGAFQDNGNLEATSNIFNWLSCGSPLVVSNLWDITDKDIDRFSMSVLYKWGFFTESDKQPAACEDICKAVANSRNLCTLRYLNGAAPIVYGLPFSYR